MEIERGLTGQTIVEIPRNEKDLNRQISIQKRRSRGRGRGGSLSSIAIVIGPEVWIVGT